MARTLRRTYRHLDAPTRLLGLTPGQWLLALLALVVFWGCLQLGFLPTRLRLSAGVFLGGLPLGLSYAGAGGGRLLEWPRRLWHTLATPRERVPGPARRGPLTFALYDGHAAEEDLPDA